MTRGPAHRRIAGRPPTAAWVLALLALLALAAPAVAQDGFFGGLFGGGGGWGYNRAPPAYPGYDNGGYDNGYDRPRRSRRHSRDDDSDRPRHSSRKDAASAQPNTPPKKNATVFVDVYGDSMGQMLAQGLDDAFADRAEIGIVQKAKGSTGLVTTSFYDWPKTIEDQLASKDPKDKVDVAVMMIGVNDRQPIVQNGKTLQYDTDEWQDAYKKRVETVAQAFRKHGVPLIWVGLPIMRDQSYANDMAAFNEVYREVAAKEGAVYVDTWEAFSDENGNFNPVGPDINGQIVKLRGPDGIHFTPPGARKLAHFVEAHIRRALEGKTPVAVLPTDPDPAKAGDKTGKPDEKKAAPAVAVVKPDAGPIKNLNELPSASNGELAALPGDKSDDPTTVLVKGEPRTPTKGRIDDFRWPSNRATGVH